VKKFFKDAMKSTIQYTNDLSNFDCNKIPLEQQICLMKASDSVKEKAMVKLKELKSKSEDSGSKARQYLDGLLKIPFGIYKSEELLDSIKKLKEEFVGFIGGKVFSGGDASGKGGDVGYGILGAILMTLGMFFAPFLFAVVGHPILERIATMESVHALFDGITAAVVGLIACTSLQILKSSITTQVGTPMDVQQLQRINENTVSVAILGITLYIMYNYKFKNQSLVLVGCTALAGQFLFI
jgi:hypothetical protein